MGEFKSFQDLVVWQRSHQLFLEIASDVETFPRSLAGRILADQILRCSGSISANISEGFGRRKGKEYMHYLIVARGSTTETINWLIKARDLGRLGQEPFQAREHTARGILRMLNKMIAQRRSDNG